ncbi:MAG: hypothetical protein CM15mP102_13880 [Flavobacteriales bacterium]|nr:MAG: hypothetical protein CM15mP102_13880 [Flavobacteriales bacterium]
MEGKFDIKINSNVCLYTIRHFDDNLSKIFQTEKNFVGTKN